MNNILIGVGGTGAKLVEATIHAGVAGLLEGDLLVGFVDQDNANGNVNRSGQLLATVETAREAWRGLDAPHKLAAACPLFRANIRALAPDHNLWVPHTNRGATLDTIFSGQAMDPNDRRLFDLLFDPGTGQADTEQHLPLDEGYRGRPHLGAAAMGERIDTVAAATGGADFWPKLNQAINDSGGEEVRLMLVGSVFGGTGAAGFPTLARLIRRRLEAKRGGTNLKIGGLLMLPYFAFDAPDDDEGVAANVARTENLLLQSKGALKYYASLFKVEHVFDELYLVGWDQFFRLGYHAAGANDQANPPLPPELIGAMATCRFFCQDHVIPDADTNAVFVSARHDQRVLGWGDLPSPIRIEPDAPYAALGALLKFSVAWQHWAPIVSTPRNTLGVMLSGDPWFKTQRLGDIRFKDSPPQREVAAMARYTDFMLKWAAANELYSVRGGLDFRLWKTGDFAAETRNPRDPVSIRPLSDEAAYVRAYDAAVPPMETGEDPPSAAVLLHRLNTEAQRDPSIRGLGRFVSALHDFSYPQVAAGRSAATA